MIRLAATHDVRWSRSLPTDSDFPSRGDARDTRVQGDSDLLAALLEPACPQVGKLACSINPPSHQWLLRNGARLCIPNVGRVFRNRSVAREFSGASHV